MKRSLTFVIIICGAFAINGKAQSLSSQTIRAKVPFAFTVGDKSLPAGAYTITILNPTSDRKALQIRSENGRATAIVQTTGVDGALADYAKLVFRRYGDRYFFAHSQMAGDTMTLAAAKTRAERAAQRALKQPAGNTEIAAF